MVWRLRGCHGNDEVFILPADAFGSWLPTLPVFRALVLNMGQARHLRAAVAFRNSLDPGFAYQFHSHRVYHGLRKLCEEQCCAPMTCSSRLQLLFPYVAETVTHAHPFPSFDLEDNESVH